MLFDREDLYTLFLMCQCKEQWKLQEQDNVFPLIIQCLTNEDDMREKYNSFSRVGYSQKNVTSCDIGGGR